MKMLRNLFMGLSLIPACQQKQSEPIAPNGSMEQAIRNPETQRDGIRIKYAFSGAPGYINLLRSRNTGKAFDIYIDDFRNGEYFIIKEGNSGTLDRVVLFPERGYDESIISPSLIKSQVEHRREQIVLEADDPNFQRYIKAAQDLADAMAKPSFESIWPQDDLVSCGRGKPECPGRSYGSQGESRFGIVAFHIHRKGNTVNEATFDMLSPVYAEDAFSIEEAERFRVADSDNDGLLDEAVVFPKRTDLQGAGKQLTGKDTEEHIRLAKEIIEVLERAENEIGRP